jgi:uncharacterized protein YjiK
MRNRIRQLTSLITQRIRFKIIWGTSKNCRAVQTPRELALQLTEIMASIIKGAITFNIKLEIPKITFSKRKVQIFTIKEIRINLIKRLIMEDLVPTKVV